MTFTEAAVEILRRAGKPLHFKDIASEAVNAGLLSHVGQTPEATMGARLLAMARREHDRKVIATDTGIFALVEWGLPVEPTASVVELEPAHDEAALPHRARERHPPLQPELTVGGRRDERRRRADEEEEGKRRKRFPPPAEVAHAWLREKGEAVTLAELASALRAQEKIAEALERDLHSFERALKEENRRRRDSGRGELFAFEDEGKVRGLEIPKELPAPARKEAAPKAEPRKEREVRREEAPKLPALDEQRRAVLRNLRRRVSSLDPASLERVAVALLEAQGYRELNLARRSPKEGPLYLARHKWGAGELRYAIRILRPGRDLGRNEVVDVRRELGHFSAQIGIVIGSGECSREAKSEANLPNSAPVMLYGNESIAEALVEANLGISKRMIEWIDYDDEFFAQMGAGEPLPQVPEVEEPAAAVVAAPTPAPAPAAEQPPREERGRRGRDRRRERRGGREGERTDERGGEAAPTEAAPTEAAPTEAAPTEVAASAETAPEAAPETTPSGAPDTTGTVTEAAALASPPPAPAEPPPAPAPVLSEPPQPPPPVAESAPVVEAAPVAPAPSEPAPAESAPVETAQIAGEAPRQESAADEPPRANGSDETAAG